jgi:hypothetical protein
MLCSYSLSMERTVGEPLNTSAHLLDQQSECQDEVVVSVYKQMFTTELQLECDCI